MRRSRRGLIDGESRVDGVSGLSANLRGGDGRGNVRRFEQLCGRHINGGDGDRLFAGEDATQERRASRLDPAQIPFAHRVGGLHESFGDPLFERFKVGLINLAARLHLPDFGCCDHSVFPVV